MRDNYVKEFFFFPDIGIMCVISVVSLGFLIPSLASIGPWIAALYRPSSDYPVLPLGPLDEENSFMASL